VFVFGEEMSVFIQESIFSIAIPTEFYCNVVEFLQAMTAWPLYPILAIGCVDEVALEFATAGFGTASVLYDRVDNNNGCRGQVIYGS
jgi:hypothetical protein